MLLLLQKVPSDYFDETYDIYFIGEFLANYK
jgi:hypothetical protein